MRNEPCGAHNSELLTAARSGIRWLRDVQNQDGGIPTFCRGWGALPFDRSSADITAHVVRAWSGWFDELPRELQRRDRKSTRLNSSHSQISYAVFCLKKKTQKMKPNASSRS